MPVKAAVPVTVKSEPSNVRLALDVIAVLPLLRYGIRLAPKLVAPVPPLAIPKVPVMSVPKSIWFKL